MSNLNDGERVSPEAMQTRIQQARREAENLKDRIKRKKDDLADGSRKNLIHHQPKGPSSSPARGKLSDAQSNANMLQSHRLPRANKSPSRGQ